VSAWPTQTLGEVCKQGGGFVRTGPFGGQLHQSDYVDDPAATPVVMPKDMTGGRIDLSTIARIDSETADRLAAHLVVEGDIILSRRGDVGRTAYISKSDLPALCGTGSIRIHPGSDGPVDHSYLRYFMRSRLAIDFLEGQAVGATMANLNAGIVQSMPVTIPPMAHQIRTGALLGSIDDLIENNRRRIRLLERMAQAIYREWFVKFRYPGHEQSTLVDSRLGPIPSDWSVVTIASISSKERHAVTGGPFGSKLGRKDYCAFGVPVIRGGNLSLGGGFDETEFIFVSEEKASELKSCVARSGDVVVTQRGTLGQIGLIPSNPKHAKYILSQSQMKVTTDPGIALSEFLYAQLRTPETTERFVAQAMSSGVPHVNLALFREFEVVLPKFVVQKQFCEVVLPVHAEADSLRGQNSSLEKIRDFLLPKLVSGQIDVSKLDLDGLLEGAA
jgi:type I restriction enzyme, S subunit